MNTESGFGYINPTHLTTMKVEGPRTLRRNLKALSLSNSIQARGKIHV